MLKRSTKRILALVCLIILLAAGYWGLKYRFSLPEVKGKTLLTYIPGRIKNKPLNFVIGVRDFKNVYKDIKSTNFYKAFIECELYKQHPSLDTIIDTVGKEFIFAAYGSGCVDLEYVFILRIQDKTGLKQLLYDIFKKDITVVQTYRDIEINAYSNKDFYVVDSGIFIAANSVDLIKNIIDIKKQVSGLSNFNAIHPWVEEKMDSSADGFTFTSNREIVNLINDVAEKRLKFQTPISGSLAAYTFHEFYIDRGIFIKSYSKSQNIKIQPALSVPASIRFIPARVLLASLNTDLDIGRWTADLSNNQSFDVFRYLNIDFKKDFVPYLGKEYGYAILGPSAETIKLALPGLILYGETKDQESQNKLEDKIKEILNVEMEEIEYSRLKYNSAKIPVFLGQKIEMCMVGLKVKGKRFIAITTSKKITEDIIDLSRGKKSGFKKSPEWREISRFLPEKFSILSYADFNALTRTVGLFIAGLRGDNDLENFLRKDPFSWIGPTGSASIFHEKYITVHTYFPMQDLTLDMWKEILKSLTPLLL